MLIIGIALCAILERPDHLNHHSYELLTLPAYNKQTNNGLDQWLEFSPLVLKVLHELRRGCFKNSGHPAGNVYPAFSRAEKVKGVGKKWHSTSVSPLPIQVIRLTAASLRGHWLWDHLLPEFKRSSLLTDFVISVGLLHMYDLSLKQNTGLAWT